MVCMLPPIAAMLEISPELQTTTSIGAKPSAGSGH